MDRAAVFVDAGYLFAQGSISLAGEKLPRGRLVLNHEEALQALADFSLRVSGVPLLRVYWYDGTSIGPTPQHITLAYLSNVKVRLGFVNSVGEQKGVDSLIVTDMISLARNHAMTDAVLLSGDEDLRVGVQQAQELGVRVHLLGIHPSRGSQSIFLLQEADTTHEWGAEEVGRFLSCRPLVAPRGTFSVEPTEVEGAAPQSTADSVGPLEQVAIQLALEIPPAEVESLVQSIRETRQIPTEIDGRLLSKGGAALRLRLDTSQKQQIREAFLSACESRLADSDKGPGRRSEDAG